MRVFTCRRPKYWLSPLMFSPDGRYIAGYKDPACPAVAGVLYTWDTASDDNREMPGVELWARHLAFAADNGVYFVRDNDVRHVDPIAWKFTPDPFLSKFNPHTISSDGCLALAETHDPRAAPGDRKLEAGRLTLRGARHEGGKWADAWTRELPYGPDAGDTGYSHLLFSTGGRFVVWVRIIAFSRLAMPLSRIVLLDAATGTSLVEEEAHLPRSATRAAAGPTGVLALVTGRALWVADPNAPRSPVVKRTNATSRHFTDLAFAPDGKRLATVSRDTAVTMWDTTTWEVVRQYEWKIGPLRSVCFAPDGLRCAAGSETGQVVVWDLDD